MVLPALINNGHKSLKVNVMLDPCSTGWYISESAAGELELQGQSLDLPIAGAGGNEIKVAPYSYLKFWVFYATFGLAKFTTNTIKTKQSHNFEESQNVLNYQLWKKIYSLIVVMATMLIFS